MLAELGAAIDARWDLAALDAEVRASQERRRVVAAANATGAVTAWDHPTPDDAAAATSAPAATSGARWSARGCRWSEGVR